MTCRHCSTRIVECDCGAYSHRPHWQSEDAQGKGSLYCYDRGQQRQRHEPDDEGTGK